MQGNSHSLSLNFWLRDSYSCSQRITLTRNCSCGMNFTSESHVHQNKNITTTHTHVKLHEEWDLNGKEKYKCNFQNLCLSLKRHILWINPLLTELLLLKKQCQIKSTFEWDFLFLVMHFFLRILKMYISGLWMPEISYEVNNVHHDVNKMNKMSLQGIHT